MLPSHYLASISVVLKTSAAGSILFVWFVGFYCCLVMSWAATNSPFVWLVCRHRPDENSIPAEFCDLCMLRPFYFVGYTADVHLLFPLSSFVYI